MQTGNGFEAVSKLLAVANKRASEVTEKKTVTEVTEKKGWVERLEGERVNKNKGLGL